MTVLSTHGLTLQLPDGRVLFQDLDLSFGRERTGIVGRNGVGKSSLIALLAGDILPTAGSVHRDGRLAVLRQTNDAEQSKTVADLFGATSGLAILHRAESGEASAEDLAEADWTLAERLGKALADTGLPDIAPTRLLGSLSGGQRMRAALAVLAFNQPEMILLDEPSNNLDRDGRHRLTAFLASWKGGAVIVSHDRHLLSHMDRIVELSALGARVYGGGYDAYRAQREAESDAAAAALKAAERQVRQAGRAAQQARERQARRDSKARASRATSSDPKILLDARQQRAETTAGRSDRLANRLMVEARDSLDRSREAVERSTPFTAGMPASLVPSGKVLVDARGLAIGYEANRPILQVDFDLVGPERIALSGPNGSGKSTLLKVIAGALPPLGGHLQVPARLAFFDQHVSLLDPASSILDNYRRLNPGAGAFECRSALARYAFRAGAALQVVATLSGGERLRAGLACVAAVDTPPELLILDEPTNHLDLDSISEVEDGLREFGGALLVVSHDRAFLDAIGVDRVIELPMLEAQ